MKKPSRKTVILLVIFIGVPIVLASLCLLFLVVIPILERNQRIQTAKDFLEAYSEGDCTRVLSFVDPEIDLSEFHNTKPTNRQDFCKEYKIQKIEINDVREGIRWAGMSSYGRYVTLEGIFEINNFGIGPYPCPAVEVGFHKVKNKWLIWWWDDRLPWLSCSYLPSTVKERQGWPMCGIRLPSGYPTPKFTLEINRKGIDSIEIIAEGIEQKGIFYIFAAPKDIKGNYDVLMDFRVVVMVYAPEGKWLTIENGKIRAINPWDDGLFIYTLRDLPPLPGSAHWEVILVHDDEVDCRYIKLPQ